MNTSIIYQRKTLAEQQQRPQAEDIEIIVEKMTAILSAEPNTMIWRGSKTDLIELLQILHENAPLYEADGSPVSYRELVSNACRRLGVPAISNPYVLARNASGRKGVKRGTIITRLHRINTQCDSGAAERFWQSLVVPAERR